LSGSVVDSIRLKSSINKDSSLKIELPNVEIKYKSTANDQSVFNPSDILKQAKQIYQNIDGIEKKFNNNSNVREESARNVKDVKSQEK
jgi:deoxyribodipyrimidine photolyase